MTLHPHEPAPPPGARSLEVLMGDIRAAKEDVRALRLAPVVPDHLHSARQSLLHAMEAYAEELTARHLPIPRQLRDDLRLQRHLRR